MFNNLRNLIKSYELSKEYTGNSSIFSDFEIGCSFDPSHNVLQEDVNPIEALKYLHEKLKIENIRFSIRWSKVMETGTFDFTYYREYLDYCFKNKLKTVLNIGPIKVFRWPEEHIPERYKNLVNKKDTITLEHAISEPALEYLNQLLKYLKKNYSKELKNIIAIQADNENFNRFGENKLFISKEFEIEVFKTIQSYFPETTLYINSSALNDLENVFDLLQDFDNSKIIIGINYYYKLPSHQKNIFLKKLDNIAINKKLIGVSAEKLKEIASTKNYLVEIGELQAEPWLPLISSPGNNFREFIFTLFRSKYLKPEKQEKMTVRYWGIEVLVAKLLANKGNIENERIANLICKINS